MEENFEAKKKKLGNNIQTWGNPNTMNINNMIHTNILSSPYFKNNLFSLKTYHEVVDEIYFKVSFDELMNWLSMHILPVIILSIKCKNIIIF